MQAFELYAVNSGFKKRADHLITYKSGRNNTQIDYISIKREERKRVRNAKVLPYEAVAKQHRLLVTDIEIDKQSKSKPKKREPRVQSMEVWRKCRGI